MKKKPVLIALIALAFLMTISQSVFAFSDTYNDPNGKKIAELKRRGILNGLKDGKFLPGGKLTNAAGVSLIVKGMDLNIDHIRFIKEPKASDYFTRVKDNAWYSEAFIIAHLNGLDIPQDIDPSAAMTREQFAHSLFKAMMTKGEYAFTKQYILIADESDITPAYMDSIQKLLISQIAELDKEQKFHPLSSITRSTAAGWVHDAIVFTETVQPVPEVEPERFPLYDVKLETKKVNERILEVTISAQAPHPGYGIKVSSITFEVDQAVIYVDAVEPEPGQMYPQVITEVQTTVYVGSQYKPVLAEVWSGDGADATVGQAGTES